ncbi:hypothetical protein NECAME_05262 [Necator americanus]|uniref:Uncharacterized protein n=1 Tax=Necator americanus TaxID=51031 RepID=W2SKZ5_NECAM|nr:hypothetical protein NECAME_05262 [Necator americanus]ETN69407.1 hypothetical protein NECAME_05262 [Necator americanus]
MGCVATPVVIACAEKVVEDRNRTKFTMKMPFNNVNAIQKRPDLVNHKEVVFHHDGMKL